MVRKIRLFRTFKLGFLLGIFLGLLSYIDIGLETPNTSNLKPRRHCINHSLLNPVSVNVTNFHLQKVFENWADYSQLKTFFNTSLIPPGVILRPQGGIGNQLFEYACSYAVAREKGWPLYTVLRLYSSRGFSAGRRDFALDQFHVPLDNLIDEKATKIDPNIRYYVNDIRLFYRENLNVDGFIQQAGYCQSEAYWKAYKSELIPMFQINVNAVRIPNGGRLESILQLIQSTDSVAVHVRRGDFLTHKGFFVPITYQRRAIRRMIKVLGKSVSPVFFVFSDDIPFTQRKFSDFHKDYRFVYVSSENTTSIQDFYLITQCKHVIIPNSTFSWWAAYLNNNLGKIVITSAFNPKFFTLWSGKDREFFKKLHGTLYHPSDWISLDVFSGEEP